MSTSEDDPFTFIFTWRTSRDDRVCQWCGPLDGEVMFFDLFSDVLISDIGGPVWDLNLDRSLLHGASGTCRCSLEVEVEVNWEKISEFVELRENLRKVNINISWIKERFKLSSSIAEARSQMSAFKAEIQGVIPAAREMNNLLTTYVSLAREVGLPPDAVRMIAALQQIRISAEMAYRSIMLLFTATGPLGWALAIGGLAVSALTLASTMEVRRPRY